MAARYEVWLLNDLGDRQALLEPVAWETARAANAVGAFSITLPGNFDPNLLQLDWIVQIWRGVGDQALVLDFAGFVRRWRWITDARGQTTVLMAGFDLCHLAKRRIVAYQADVAGYSLFDNVAADQILTAIARTNLGSSAGTGRDLTSLGFAVQPDLAIPLGTITVRAQWMNVFDAFTETVQSASWDISTPLYWDIRYTDLDTMTLAAGANQIGQDHSWPDGNPPVLFGLEYGNMEEPFYEEDYSNEVTHVYAVGQWDDGTKVREVVEVDDPARRLASAWNRCEAYVDAADAKDTDQLTHLGQVRLYQGRPRKKFGGRMLDTETCCYGRDWQYGDRVTAVYQGRTFDAVVKALKIKVSGGKEAIDAQMEVLN